MTKTAYFGYSTYAEYKSARLRTAHTKLLRDLWSQESQHDHDIGLKEIRDAAANGSLDARDILERAEDGDECVRDWIGL